MLKLSNCNFTEVSSSVNLSTKIINNLPICAEVIESIETVYRFCRDDITINREFHILTTLLVKYYLALIFCSLKSWPLVAYEEPAPSIVGLTTVLYIPVTIL